MKAQIIRHLLTVSDYHLMQEVGILSEDDLEAKLESLGIKLDSQALFF